MASITSMVNGSSSLSSIYGNKNILSGLASGMDTESMIENAVSGIKTKINSLTQKRTKVEWKQQALRSIIDKLANFSNKYTSYASGTNLLSPSFFNNAVKVTSSGKYADKVAASGRSSSSIEMLGVRQLARKASYNVRDSFLTSAANGISAKDAVDLGGDYVESNVSGTMTIAYGGSRTIDISLDDTVYETTSDLAAAINKQLEQTNVTKKDGTVVKASTMVDVRTDYDGQIYFEDKQKAGNSVSVTGATGKLGDLLNLQDGEKRATLKLDNSDLSTTHNRAEFLSGQEFKVTLDGVTKTIKLGEYDKDTKAETVQKDLQDKLDKAFGKDKVRVSGGGSEQDLQLKMEIDKGSTMTFQGDAAKALGLENSRNYSYLDTGRTLRSVLGEDAFKEGNGMPKVAAEGAVKEVTADNGDFSHYVDSKGNRVAADKDGKYYQVDDKGAFYYDFQVNGVSVGKFSENSAAENVMTAINNSTEAGVTVSYSKTTGQFQFTARESGEAGRIDFGEGLAQKMFGEGTEQRIDDSNKDQFEYTAGQDAIFSMKVNGQVFEDAKRSDNSFEVDGMTLNLKGTFNYEADSVAEDGTVVAGKLMEDAEAVSFTSSADADKIVDAVKAMVNDYNEMITEIKNAYTTMRPTRSGSGNNAKYYEPLTADDMDGMSESEIAAWEAKAKEGILFGDRDLSSLYSLLTDAITPTGTDGSKLRSYGIETAYSGGLTTISLDEDKLRAALDADPDGVKEAFTKSKDNGASSDGLMQGISAAVDRYGKTTGTKGILVERAGSARAPVTLNNNTMQDELNNFDDQIERWETKLSNQIDRYTSQFTRLEQLIAEMNSQSSALMGLMGSSY